LWDAKKLANVKSRKDPVSGRSYWEIPDPLEFAMGLPDGGWTQFLARTKRPQSREVDDDETEDAA
jgi:hypothetical protein